MSLNENFSLKFHFCRLRCSRNLEKKSFMDVLFKTDRLIETKENVINDAHTTMGHV